MTFPVVATIIFSILVGILVLVYDVLNTYLKHLRHRVVYLENLIINNTEELMRARDRVAKLEGEVARLTGEQNGITDAKVFTEEYWKNHPAPHIERRVRRGEFGPGKSDDNDKSGSEEFGDNIW